MHHPRSRPPGSDRRTFPDCGIKSRLDRTTRDRRPSAADHSGRHPTVVIPIANTTFPNSNKEKAMGRMDGKVALVTGAARGMGRAHAIRLAEEGADILALDCPPDTGLPYPTGSADDLQITVKEVEALGRRIIAREGDVREQSSLDKLVAEGVNAFGGLDVAVANA